MGPFGIIKKTLNKTCQYCLPSFTLLSLDTQTCFSFLCMPKEMREHIFRFYNSWIINFYGCCGLLLSTWWGEGGRCWSNDHYRTHQRKRNFRLDALVKLLKKCIFKPFLPTFSLLVKIKWSKWLSEIFNSMHIVKATFFWTIFYKSVQPVIIGLFWFMRKLKRCSLADSLGQSNSRVMLR